MDNSHPRDQLINFTEKGHKYTISGHNKDITSVTTLIHKHFPKFDSDKIINRMMSGRNWKNSKYFGKTKDEIKDEWSNNGKNASKLGTSMHNAIEYYLNNTLVEEPDTIEFHMFKTFWHDFNEANPTLRLYRTEWVIYDEEVSIAGSVDCIMANDNDDLILIDWKRSKEIKMKNNYEKGFGPFLNMDHCNFSHYSLQLNLYRQILERKYNKNIILMILVVLHPNNESYKCYNVNRIELDGLWNVLTNE